MYKHKFNLKHQQKVKTSVNRIMEYKKVEITM